MKSIHIWRVPIHTVMSHVFDEITDAYQLTFASLGYRVSVGPLPVEPRQVDHQFVVGTTGLGPEATLPPGCIVLQFEQTPDWPWGLHLRQLYQGHRTWNYDPIVNERFREAGFVSQYVPLGWSPAFNPYKSLKRTETNDIVFAGWMFPERVRKLNLLREAGLSVVASNNLWGVERAQLIAQSKVVLSMASLDMSPFMSARIVPCWAMRAAVLTEPFLGAELQPGVERAVAISDGTPEGLVREAVALCRDAARRKKLADQGFDYLRTRPMTEAVKNALVVVEQEAPRR